MRVSSPTGTEGKTVGVPQPPGQSKESSAELLGVFETKPVNKEFSWQGVGFGISPHSGRELAWWHGLVQIPKNGFRAQSILLQQWELGHRVSGMETGNCRRK